MPPPSAAPPQPQPRRQPPPQPQPRRHPAPRHPDPPRQPPAPPPAPRPSPPPPPPPPTPPPSAAPAAPPLHGCHIVRHHGFRGATAGPQRGCDSGGSERNHRREPCRRDDEFDPRSFDPRSHG